MAGTTKGRKVALLSGIALVVLVALVAWTNWKGIVFFIEFENLGPNAQGYSEYRHRKTGIVFVRLPGGTFSMGSPEGEEGRNSRELQHGVTVSPFLIAKYEVTQAEWRRVMRDNPSRFKGDTLPVETVFWKDCQEFCKKTGLSLPTEAQWEYACRAGTEGPYGGTGKLDDMGWYKENSGGRTHPVGEKQPNHFGLHDMHGNLFEWCADSFDAGFYTKPEATQKDPLCTTGSEEYRVLRGGSWRNNANRCRSAVRVWGDPSHTITSTGFRPSAPVP